MKFNEFYEFLQKSFTTEVIKDSNKKEFFVITNYTIPSGILQGQKCNIAFEYRKNDPYLPASSIHIKPILVPMDMKDLNLRTQASSLGSDWQYWSRNFGCQVNAKPEQLWALFLSPLINTLRKL